MPISGVCDETIFTTQKLEGLKEREIAMIQINERLLSVKGMLLQLNHPYSAQSNEAMNTSVAALAPKGKHYSSTESLRTRVGIAGVC